MAHRQLTIVESGTKPASRAAAKGKPQQDVNSAALYQEFIPFYGSNRELARHFREKPKKISAFAELIGDTSLPAIDRDAVACCLIRFALDSETRENGLGLSPVADALEKYTNAGGMEGQRVEAIRAIREDVASAQQAREYSSAKSKALEDLTSADPAEREFAREFFVDHGMSIISDPNVRGRFLDILIGNYPEGVKSMVSSIHPNFPRLIASLGSWELDTSKAIAYVQTFLASLERASAGISILDSLVENAHDISAVIPMLGEIASLQLQAKSGNAGQSSDSLEFLWEGCVLREWKHSAHAETIGAVALRSVAGLLSKEGGVGARALDQIAKHTNFEDPKIILRLHWFLQSATDVNLKPMLHLLKNALANIQRKYGVRVEGLYLSSHPDHSSCNPDQGMYGSPERFLPEYERVRDNPPEELAILRDIVASVENNS